MDANSNFPSWGNVQPAGGERHLPVYLLLDTSGSMELKIQSVRNGVEQFQREVSDDPFARDIVRVGIVPFSNDATLLGGGLVPISQMQTPNLVASGVTRLDRAFAVTLQSMDRDVVRPVKGGQRGDYKPAIFV